MQVSWRSARRVSASLSLSRRVNERVWASLGPPAWPTRREERENYFFNIHAINIGDMLNVYIFLQPTAIVTISWAFVAWVHGIATISNLIFFLLLSCWIVNKFPTCRCWLAGVYRKLWENLRGFSCVIFLFKIKSDDKISWKQQQQTDPIIEKESFTSLEKKEVSHISKISSTLVSCHSSALVGSFQVTFF